MNKTTLHSSIKRKIIIILITVLAIIIVRQINLKLDQQNQVLSKSEYLKTTWPTLFTQASLTLKANKHDAQRSFDSIAKYFDQYTEMLKASSSLDSIIYNANIGDTIALNSISYELFKYAEKKFIQTDGAINPGIGNLLRLWGLMWNMKPKLPDFDSINLEVKLMQKPFYRTLNSSKSIIILQTNRHFALGAFSKGNAIYKATEILKHFNIENYFLEVGGDIATKGLNPKNKHWISGIKNPDQKEKLMGSVFLLENLNALATSGGYEKFFIDSLGQKHHHIINPKTGFSVNDKKSVSALSTDAREADFWATYLFVLPFDSACKIVENNPDVEAIIKNSNDSIFISSKIKASFNLYD